MRTQRSLDFTNLNPITTKLQLAITTAEKLNIPITHQPCEIARAIHARARSRAERIRHKLHRSRIRAVQIAARDTVATDVQLTGNTNRTGAELLVQHVKLCVRDRPSNRRQLGPHIAVVGETIGADDVSFSWTIVIIEHAAVQPGEQFSYPRCDLQLLAGRDDLVQTGHDTAVLYRNFGE